jgi:hypothetical protein
MNKAQWTWMRASVALVAAAAAAMREHPAVETVPALPQPIAAQ